MAGASVGTINQLITIELNANYQLSFYLAGNLEQGPSTKQFEVEGDSLYLQLFIFDITGMDSNNRGWGQKSVFLHVPSGDLTVLKFVKASGSCCWGTALEKIEVDHLNPTPEFLTIVLPVALIVGMLGTVLFIQKSKEH